MIFGECYEFVNNEKGWIVQPFCIILGEELMIHWGRWANNKKVSDK